MKKNLKQKFLELIEKNPPPCLPGSDFYYLNEETGEIMKEKSGVEKIVLDSDLKWHVLEEDDYEDLEIRFSFREVRKIRDNLSVKYAIFKQSNQGIFCTDDNIKYSYVKMKILDTKKMEDEDSYLDTILQIDNEIVSGDIICFDHGIESKNVDFYLLSEDEFIKERLRIYGINEILEKIFNC